MVYFKNTRDGCLIVARSEPTRLSQGTHLPISPSLADPKTSIPQVDKPAQHPTSWSVPVLKSLQPKTDEIEDCPNRTIQLLNHIDHISTTDDTLPPSFLLRGKTGLSPSSSPLLITVKHPIECSPTSSFKRGNPDTTSSKAKKIKLQPKISNASTSASSAQVQNIASPHHSEDTKTLPEIASHHLTTAADTANRDNESFYKCQRRKIHDSSPDGVKSPSLADQYAALESCADLSPEERELAANSSGAFSPPSAKELVRPIVPAADIDFGLDTSDDELIGANAYLAEKPVATNTFSPLEFLECQAKCVAFINYATGLKLEEAVPIATRKMN
ncbi:hypothetical protein ACFE04_027018 [Oxalis oulophora]